MSRYCLVYLHSGLLHRLVFHSSGSILHLTARDEIFVKFHRAQQTKLLRSVFLGGTLGEHTFGLLVIDLVAVLSSYFASRVGHSRM